MEARLCFSSLKQTYLDVLAEARIPQNEPLALAIWEQIKNTEHRPEGTEAKISVKTKTERLVIETRNLVSPDEIQRHLWRNVMPQDDQLYLEDHRGESIIHQFIGDGEYKRFIDPFTKEMVTRIYLPTTRPAK